MINSYWLHPTKFQFLPAASQKHLNSHWLHPCVILISIGCISKFKISTLIGRIPARSWFLLVTFPQHFNSHWLQPDRTTVPTYSQLTGCIPGNLISHWPYPNKLTNSNWVIHISTWFLLATSPKLQNTSTLIGCTGNIPTGLIPTLTGWAIEVLDSYWLHLHWRLAPTGHF